MILRRDLLRAAGAFGVLGASRARAAARRPIVLVHGAWHGGWCWRDVAPLLRAAGHDVHVLTLTGMGERAHLAEPEVTLSTHADDVANLIRAEELRDVVLVGHSYAGFVISLAADRIKPALAKLIYLDALIPEEGKAFLDAATAEELTKTAERGFLLPPPELAFFGLPADHPKAAWVRRRLTAHPLGTLTAAVRYADGGPAGLPKVYIRCTVGAEQPDKERALIGDNPEWTWRTLHTGHDAMVTEPAALAKLLIAVSA
jgi:pimeloyl-ACP methyl ester carboxylesterase